jgi:hypothetical protein
MRILALAAVFALQTPIGISTEAKDVRPTTAESSPLYSIKSANSKSLPYGKILIFPGPPETRVLYDRGYKGRLCVTSCHFYDGILSKWSNFFLQLQPYESTCFALAGGCNTTHYPEAPKEIIISVQARDFVVRMTDESRNEYYLPLEIRKEITKNPATDVVVKTKWEKFPAYKIGRKSVLMLAKVLDSKSEIAVSQQDNETGQKTKSERLTELKEALDKDLINKDEYNRARMLILQD